jgi:hypothetical protein
VAQLRTPGGGNVINYYKRGYYYHDVVKIGSHAAYTALCTAKSDGLKAKAFVKVQGDRAVANVFLNHHHNIVLHTVNLRPKPRITSTTT